MHGQAQHLCDGDCVEFSFKTGQIFLTDASYKMSKKDGNLKLLFFFKNIFPTFLVPDELTLAFKEI